MSFEDAVQENVRFHTFPNGLTLLAEHMAHVRSAAFYFLVPSGCVYDPVQTPGLAGLLVDMITRGAGSLDNRDLTLALDNLGLDRNESVGLFHTRFWGTTLASNLFSALQIYSDILRRPHLPQGELEACKSLAIQSINGIEDEPASKVMLELRKHFFPAPLSNNDLGTLEGIEAVDYETLKAFHAKQFSPQGTILSVAGNIDWEQLKDFVAEQFGDWQGKETEPIRLGPKPKNQLHIEKQLEQTQIAIAYPSVSVTNPDYYQALGCVQVLSGGMGARLFTEIREKEGLCYSVSASYQPMRDRGAVVAHAASLNHQAQRTLDKLIQELKRLPAGIEEEEVDRVRVGLKTGHIMQQESTSARATSMASDWYYLGRIRSFQEIRDSINGLSAKSLTTHLQKNPPGKFSIVTLGPNPLSLPE